MCRSTRRVPHGVIGVAAMLLPAWCQAQAPPKYTIATVAGNGTSGFSGDAGAATTAQLNNPCTVAVDGSGNLYIADQLNNRVRMVAPDGTISTVAGSGTAGFAGDGSAATSAQLNRPCGLALDSSGNLYIADAANHVVRKRATSGTISTVAGNASAGYAGDEAAATDASLNTPIGLAVDAAGNLYIADTLNHRIRKVATDGKITTVAGNGFEGRAGDGGAATSASLTGPQGVALDVAGNLYIADTSNALVRKVAADGTIATLAGTGAKGYSGDGGPATQAALNYPKGLAVDTAGNLYIADSFNSRIRMVAATGVITTLAGNGMFGDSGDDGPATSARLRFPSGLALGAAGNLYIADSQNSRIRRLTPTPQEDDPAAAPSISPGGVVGAAAFGAFTSVAPGSWIEIYGSKLAASSRGWAAADFKGVKAPTSLDGTTVMIGGQAAFIAYISPTQLNAQLPSNLGAGALEITVTTAAGTSAPYAITVIPTQPGLYAPPSLKLGDQQYVAALLSDGATYVLPSGALPEVASRPARPGETIVLYGVGFGPVIPSVEAGEIVRQGNTLATPLQVFFGQTPATVAYAGLTPGTVGVYQINVVVPNVAAGDAVPLTFTLGGASGAQTLYTAVQN